MFPLGFFAFALAAYLVDCAVKNRPPVATFEAILKDPGNMRTILASSDGTGYQSGVDQWSATVGGVADVSGAGAGATAASQGSTGAGSTASAEQGTASPKALEALQLARSQVGKPYRWGATGPNAFDCSGLMQWAYRHAGVSIPRTTAGQVVGGKAVSQAQLQPGDLVFPYPGHVFMYAGGGMIVEAPHTGTTVRYTKLYKFWKARRYA